MDNKLVRKGLQTSLKLDGSDEGSVTAVISKFGVVDRDGDIVAKSAFSDGQPIKLCSWGHKWDQLPVGRGVVKVVGDEAVFEGKFFLQTIAGRECYETVKALSDLQEWSWGFSVPSGGWKWTEHPTEKGKRVRLIEKAEAFEVSPVLVGSNPETSTLDIKAFKASEEELDELEQLADEGKELPKVEDETVTHEVKDASAECAGVCESIRGLMAKMLADGASAGALSSAMCALRDIEYLEWSERMGEMDEVMRYGVDAPDAEARKAEITEAIKSSLAKLAEAGIVLPAAEEPSEPDEETFADHGERTSVQLNGYLQRARVIQDLRAKEGRVLSDVNRTRLVSLRSALTEAVTALDGLLEETAPKGKDETEGDEGKGAGAPEPDSQALARSREQRLAVARARGRQLVSA